MKINSIKLFRPQATSIQPNNSAKEASQRSQIIMLSSAYMPLIAFNGETENAKFRKQLIELNGVHCPACGVKMLNTENYHKLVNESYKIKNLSEFAQFLKDNRDNVRGQFQSYITSLNGIATQYPERTIDEAMTMLYNGSSRLVIKRINQNGEYIGNLLNSPEFSEADKAKISKVSKYMKEVTLLPKYKEFSDLIEDNIRTLESPKKYEISRYINKIFDAYKTRSILYNIQHSESDVPKRVQLVAEMLNRSKNNIVKVFSTKEDESRFNTMLLCKGCSINYKNFKFIERASRPKEKLEQYVDDISNAVNEGKLTGNNSYLYEFMGSVNAVTNHRILLNRKNLDNVVKARVFSECKKDYVFGSYEGVPCPYCGVTTITHDQKVELYKQIQDAEGLYDLKNIGLLNKQHIHPLFRGIVDRFNKAVEENQNITDEEVMKILKKQSHDDIKNYMKGIKKKIEKYEKYNQLTFIEREFINDFLDKIDKKYILNDKVEPFIFDDFDKLIYETFANVNPQARKTLLNITRVGLHEVYVKDSIVNPKEELSIKLGGEAKVMFQNLFKMSVLTVDHMAPLSKGGKDKDSNKIGSCKLCNHAKGRINMPIWIKRHPEANKNFPKHLRYISSIIEHEKMKNMKHYPNEVAKEAIKLSNGNLKIPTDYDTKG